MATDDSGTADLSVAPVVGPDDPRRFTDSGIEVEPLTAIPRAARAAIRAEAEATGALWRRRVRVRWS